MLSMFNYKICSPHNIAEILQLLALSTNKSTNQSISKCNSYFFPFISKFKLIFLFISDYNKLIWSNVTTGHQNISVTFNLDSLRSTRSYWSDGHVGIKYSDKTDFHDITEMFLKVSLNTITLTLAQL